MLASGFLYRTAEPDRGRPFVWFIDHAGEMLSSRGLQGVSGASFFLACRAHCDIALQLPDLQHGVTMAVGLSPYNGSPCSNAWRKLLDGSGGLRPSAKPPDLLLRQTERSRVQIYRDGVLADP
jgi:hypothetical protein